MPSRRRAFTLVELLVVVGIVALLAALLFPALASALEHAKAVQCANNLRQVVAAMTMYEADYRIFPYCDDPSYGKFSSTIEFAGGLDYNETWVAALVNGRYLLGTNFAALDLGVLGCPSTDEGRRNLHRVLMTNSPEYGMNFYFNPGPWQEWRKQGNCFRGMRSRMAKDAARKILLTETWAMAGSVEFTTPPVVKHWSEGHGHHWIGAVGWGELGGPVLDLRHLRGRAVNVAFMAGNVELVYPPNVPRPPNFGEDHPFAPDRFMYTGG